jgi:hypothetical protein
MRLALVFVFCRLVLSCLVSSRLAYRVRVRVRVRIRVRVRVRVRVKG